MTSRAEQDELDHSEEAETGEEILTTRCREPVSRLTPYRKKPRTLFGIDRVRMEILDDIDDPINVEWEAETGKNWDDLP